MYYLVTILLLSVWVTEGKGIDKNNDNMLVSVQCPSRQNQCRDINSDKDRVVTLLDDGLQVMCDTKTDGGGWIIFQRRINGNVSFYRGWEEYKYGFGDFDVGEFYLGNEFIHQLTSKRHYEMRVDLKFNSTNYFANYSRFRILGEPEKYRLQISGYFGNATDNLTSDHNNQKFSTFDNDNDNDKKNCAQVYSGAWWYNGCHQSNLNGQWGSKTSGVGMNWFQLTTHYVSVSYSEMKFREINY
ncbi:Ficolin-1 [Bulinus truncatus]|nr:Ficolin-1 [Bulinus truncatus]